MFIWFIGPNNKIFIENNKGAYRTGEIIKQSMTHDVSFGMFFSKKNCSLIINA
ncbi:MAG: hypothetical protein IMZ43_00295 [Thermoplasmata archaeon]|nr:hypothetical protein [Thermoplasmata archaeon]